MDQKPNTAEPANSRSWFQFRLRTLLIGVVLVAVQCAFIGRQANIVAKRVAMLAEIRAAGGSVGAYSFVAANKQPIPWYRYFFGDRDAGRIHLPDSMLDRVDEIQQVFPESTLVSAAR